MINPEINPIKPYTVDITSCDREPIHHISAVQPIGCLIALSTDWRISQVSSNIAEFLGLSVDGLLGTHLGDVLPGKTIHAIRNSLSSLNGAYAIERSFAVQLSDGGALYDLAIHRTGKLIIIEAEPNIPSGDLNAGAMVRSM